MKEFEQVLESEEEIRKLIGYPSELVNHKSIDHIDSHCVDFMALSPLLFISTSDNQGFCDVSPRGDAPGFVHIIDEKRLVIPERPGNRRIDSIRNILKNPRVGLIFMIPGLEETLRINGKAQIIKDPQILDELKVNGKIPLLGIGVTVEECFIHCAKAFKRSQLWNHESWVSEDKLPSPANILSAHINRPRASEKEIYDSLIESYTKRLY